MLVKQLVQELQHWKVIHLADRHRCENTGGGVARLRCAMQFFMNQESLPLMIGNKTEKQDCCINPLSRPRNELL